MFLKKTLLISLSLLVAHVCSEEDDRTDWINPDDMLNFDPASTTMVKQSKPSLKEKDSVYSEPPSVTDQPNSMTCPECKCEQADCPAIPKCLPVKDCMCEQASVPLLRNYIKTLLSHVDNQSPSERSEYVMRISLTPDQILILSRFVKKKGTPAHVHDVHEILTTMMDIKLTTKQGPLERFAQLLEHKLGLSLQRLIQFFLLISLASVVMFIELRLKITWRRRVGQLIVLMFVISVPWTWYELYKQAEIEQQSVAIKKIPSECQENASNYWKSLLSLVSLQKDKCTAYYENIMIDPIVKVPPTKAIAVTFVRFFLAPLKDVGKAFSEFIQALLEDLPITYQPIALVMVSVFLFMLLFMMFGYRIRLPFFLTIEKSQQQAVANGQVHQAINDGNQQILEQLQTITERIKTNEIQFNEKIDDLKHVQEMAIEYNTSSTSMSESPSVPIQVMSAHQTTSAEKLSDKSWQKMPDSQEKGGARKGNIDSATTRKHGDHHDKSVSKKKLAIDTVSPGSVPQGDIDTVSPGSVPQGDIDTVSQGSVPQGDIDTVSPGSVPQGDIDTVLLGSVPQGNIDTVLPGSVPEGNIDTVLPDSVPQGNIDTVLPGSVPQGNIDTVLPGSVPQDNIDT